MGNYTTIRKTEGLEAKLKAVYEKHLKENRAQFLSDFGDLNSFDEIFVELKDGDYELKTGVLGRNFFSDEFINDVNNLIG